MVGEYNDVFYRKINFIFVRISQSAGVKWVVSEQRFRILKSVYLEQSKFSYFAIVLPLNFSGIFHSF